MRHLQLVSSLLLCALLLPACATKRNKIDNPFPTADEVRLITSQPPPTDVIDKDGVRVEEWTLEGPFNNLIARTPKQNNLDAWDALLATEFAPDQDVILSEEMDCVAREIGRFALAHENKPPTESLRRFIHHRCGATSSQRLPIIYTFDKKPGESITPEDLHPDFAKKLAKRIDKSIPRSSEGEVGVWFGESETRAVMTVALGRAIVKVDPIKQNHIQGEPVVLRGVLAQKSATIGASVTYGDFGAKVCVVDPDVALPAFEITCPTLPTDGLATFTILAGRKGSIFATEVFAQSVMPGMGPAASENITYTPNEIVATLEAIAPQVQGSEPNQRAIAYVNTIRSAAKLDPLDLAVAHSATAQQVTPYLLEALYEDDDETSNTLAMGLLAGYEIDGPIVDGDIHFRVSADGDLPALLAEMLASPYGRLSFLSEDASTFSIGTLTQGDAIGIVALTHEFLPGSTHASRAKRVAATITEGRKLKGKSRFKRSSKLRGTATKHAEKVQQGKMTFQQASESLATKVSESYNQPVMILTLMLHNLDDFSFHKELMRAKSPEGVIMVAPFQPEGYPWTIYGVTIVVPQSKLKRR